MKLNAFLPFRIARLASKTTTAISKVYGERFGLSRDEWRVLAAAGEAEVQPTRAIAEQTGLDKVAISRAASALEDRGLIARSEDRRDRRIKILRLTEDGRAMLGEIERVVHARESYLLEALAPEERAAFEAAVDKLAARAEALADPDLEVLTRMSGAVKGGAVHDRAAEAETDDALAARYSRERRVQGYGRAAH